MDLPLYTTVTHNELSDLGSSTYHFIDSDVVLNQIMQQSGESPEQILEIVKQLLLIGNI